MKTKSMLLAMSCLLCTFLACGGTSTTSSQNDQSTPAGEHQEVGKLEITVDYQRQDGRGSNQYAVWIENAAGSLIKTLYVTNFTAEGGYKKRPDCTPLWVTKAKAKTLNKDEIDAFSGATPQTGAQVYTWDGTDQTGKKVEAGSYTFVVEATYLGSNIVVFKSDFETTEQEMTYTPEAEFNSSEAQNRDMVKKVTARYIPGN